MCVRICLDKECVILLAFYVVLQVNNVPFHDYIFLTFHMISYNYTFRNVFSFRFREIFLQLILVDVLLFVFAAAVPVDVVPFRNNLIVCQIFGFICLNANYSSAVNVL